MFKKIVSNLPFSPALVGQIGFYSNRLRQEEATRRLGLLFTVMALILQSFAVFVPPQQAQAGNANDLIPGGVQSKTQLVQAYDEDGDIKTLLNYLGITRGDLESLPSQTEQLCNDDKNLQVFGRQPLLSSAEGETVYQVPSGDQTLSFYARPLYMFDKQRPVCRQVFIGHSATAGQFAIAKDSANVILYQQATVAPAANPAGIVKSKSARNLTHDTEITAKSTVSPADRIEYTLQTKNTGAEPVTLTIAEPLADTLEYAELIDSGGAAFDQTTQTLSWINIVIAPGATDIRKIVVEIDSIIPTTPYSASNPSSYDCIITNIYGNTLNIAVACPVAKTVETTVQDLPTTGMSANVAFAAGLLGVTVYFYVRNRQLSREIKLVRKEFNTGPV